MERRDFIRFCAASAAVTGYAAVAADSKPRMYSRARLVSDSGAPLRAKAVPANRNLIFHYPYESTPCFLLNLGRPVRPAQLKTSDNRSYEWKGGVGAGGSIVAFSAICAHQLSYPTRDISFISFRTERSARNRHANVIHCCSEHSQYDPAEGARVVAGPATTRPPSAGSYWLCSEQQWITLAMRLRALFSLRKLMKLMSLVG